MKMSEFLEILGNKYACSDALDYIEKSKQKPEKLWNKCKMGSWMLWLLRISRLGNKIPYKRLCKVTFQEEQSGPYTMSYKDILIDGLICMSDPRSCSSLQDLSKKEKNKIEKSLANYLRKKFSWKQVEKTLSRF